tara:strand:- start:191 stop:1432 length:1242 start_codon:yes stop_codon:yes gene_type:complete
MENYIKNHIKSLKPAATLAINEKCKKLREEGKQVFNFGFGGSPFSIPDKIVSALKNNAHKKEYLPSVGLKELREAIAKYINQYSNNHFAQDDIIIGPGTKQLMFLLQLGFEGEFIFPTGSWVSYEPQAIIAKNKVHWIKTSRENNWFPKPEDIEKKIKSIKNKNIILFLNSPNNPSGAICKNLKEIAEVAKKHEIIVLSDEIYTQLQFDGKYNSISEYYPEGTIISSGLSKWLGAGGWRLGFFAVPKKLKKILEIIKILSSESLSAVSAPIQYAAVEAFSNSNNFSDYINNTRNILFSVGNYVYNNLKSNKVLINPPQGGFYIMPEFLNSKFKTSSEMCDDIITKTGVALLPGSDFGFSRNKMLTRLSYTDFDGETFLKNVNGRKKLDNDIIEKYAPNVVEGTKRLAEWSKSL